MQRAQVEQVRQLDVDDDLPHSPNVGDLRAKIKVSRWFWRLSINRNGRVAVPRNPDIPLRAPTRNEIKWAAQSRSRGTALPTSTMLTRRLVSIEEVHGLDSRPVAGGVLFP